MFVSGSCHCKAIGFEAEVDSVSLMVCHCNDCQLLTGSAFRVTVPVKPENFKLLRGSPSVYLKIADSGSQRRHAFCGTCGTPVFRMPADNNPNYSLRVGTLDQKRELEAPRRQIWTERRLPWVTEIGSISEVAARNL